MKKYIQYGCGWSCPEGWINFDASPTLKIQNIPLIGLLLKGKLNTTFPPKVQFGNIIKGLPNIIDDSCDGIYCSHILEHLSYNDCLKALENTYNYLKHGGVFRLIVPDLMVHINIYLESVKNGDSNAALKFIRDYTILGQVERKTGIKGIIRFFIF